MDRGGAQDTPFGAFTSWRAARGNAKEIKQLWRERGGGDRAEGTLRR